MTHPLLGRVARFILLVALASVLFGALSVPTFAASCVTISHTLKLKSTDIKTKGDVSRLQEFLRTESEVRSKPKVTGTFDARTKRALTEWQKTRGKALLGTLKGVKLGLVDEKTRTALAICPNAATTIASKDSKQTTSSTKQMFSRTLERGMSGPDVILLQQILISEGFLGSDLATGQFGSATEAAVKRYQRGKKIVSSGSPATTGYGSVGPKTQVALSASYASRPISSTKAETKKNTSGGGASSSGGSSSTDSNTDSSGITPAENDPAPDETVDDQKPAPVNPVVPVPPPPPPTSGLSLNDFWDGSATFQYVRQQKSPSAGGGDTGGVFYNLTAQVTVVGSTWYRFSREAVINEKNKCAPEAYSRMVLYKSTDQGSTWGSRTVVVEPTVGTDYKCGGTDGSVFFDEPNATWHALFQCTDGPGGTAPWGVCHASIKSSNPIGTWTVDAKQSVSRGDIIEDLMALKGWHDEGTPHIVEKANGYFYVTFHGYDGASQGVRVIARTPDFKTWAVDTKAPLFGPDDCGSWNVNWKGKCKGGGWADMLADDGWYYMLIEGVDKNLACVHDQNWVFGLLRSKNLLSSNWQRLPDGPGILFNSAQLDRTGHTRPCGLQHGLIFRSGNDVYLSVMHAFDELSETDNDPKSARYYYKLEKGGPVASYTFRHGDARTTHNLSDSVSRGNLEAKVDNVVWQNPGVAMNGKDSVVVLPDAEILKRKAPWTLELVLTLAAMPEDASAFIAGDRDAAWLELYQNGDLCAMGWSSSGLQKVCTSAKLNTSTKVILSATSKALTLSVDAKTIGSVDGVGIPSLKRLSIGSVGTAKGRDYASWKGTLSKILFYDRATIDTVAITASKATPEEKKQEATPTEKKISFTYDADTDLSHGVGRVEGSGWSAVVSVDSVGYLSYGPYAENWGEGDVNVSFYLLVDNNTANNAIVATLDVYDVTTGETLKTKNIRRQDFAGALSSQAFTLPVSLAGRAGHIMEARVLWLAESYMKMDRIVVKSK